MEEKQYTISQHAKERFAERIMERDNMTDIRMFINDHDNDICERINKLITYGTMIYEGQIKDYKANQVYLKDRWVIIVDPKKNNVVTLYKINLGDDEVSDLFINKMLNKISSAKNYADEISEKVNKDISEWRELIDGYQKDIDQYKQIIKQKQEIIDSYNTLIKNANVDISEATYNVQVLVEQLICKRQF